MDIKEVEGKAYGIPEYETWYIAVNYIGNWWVILGADKDKNMAKSLFLDDGNLKRLIKVTLPNPTYKMPV